MTTVEEEYRRLKALDEARTQGDFRYERGGIYANTHKRPWDRIVTPGGDSGGLLSPEPYMGAYCRKNNGEFLANAPAMMALIDKLMEERDDT